MASKHIVEKGVVALLYGQHLLIGEWVDKVVEMGVDEAEGHAAGEEVEVANDGEVEFDWEGGEM